MLTERERHGIAELLSRMETVDLVSLAQTVTSRLLALSTDSENIEAIILHTDKATDLLKRKKIKKELLFKYLHAKRVPIESVSDKGTHVCRVLEVWNSTDDWDRSLHWNMDSDNSIDGPPPPPVPSRNASHSSLCSLDLARDPGLTTFGRGELGVAQLIRADLGGVQVSGWVDTPSNSQDTIPGGGSGVRSQEQSGLGWGQSQLNQAQCQEMARNFVRWYFHLLNSSLDTTDRTDWGPSHFWPDASARVEMVSGGDQTETVEVNRNAEEVCSMLVQVFRRHKLRCNPNLCEEGVRGRLDPHGLVLVLACGTLHNHLTVCGVFEQVFGLVRDPSSDNNWKIKETEIRLVGGPVSGQHSLANSSLPAIVNS